MSGPVWERGKDGPYTCDECLAEVPEAMLEGEVRDGEFIVRRVLCDRCYSQHIGSRPKAS
jgi:hypothetical protein